MAGIAVGPVRPPSVKAQAARTTKAGLMNSEGCRPKIQRRAPLTSAPNMSARMMSANDTANVSNAARRTCRGDRNEVAIISAAVGISIKAWRLTKWKVERLSRSATAGLAASAITRPITISAMNDPISHRSAVRIQSATGPRSTLETMSSISPFARAFRTPRAARAIRRPAPERRRRAPRNSRTDRTTRRPAKAAPRARAPATAPRPRPPPRWPRSKSRSARRERRRRACARIRRSPRRSDRPWRRGERAARSGSTPPAFGLPPRIQ